MDSCFAFLFWLIYRFNNQLNVNLFCFRLKPYDSESDESDDGLDYDDLPPLEIPESDHKLQYTYNLWFAKKGSHRASVIINKCLNYNHTCNEPYWLFHNFRNMENHCTS